MKQLIIYLACIFIAGKVFPQSYDNNWVFGDSCGLNFSSGEPAFFETVMESFEACASVSDSLGNLLFYTNGETVWNKDHEVMINGDSLEIGGDPSGEYGSSYTQGVTVCKITNKHQFYIIYKGLLGIEYSRASFEDIMEGEITEKNVLLNSYLEAGYGNDEKMQVVKHGNGEDWWLILHGYYYDVFSGLNEGDDLIWIKYLIKDDEINGPYFENSGKYYGENNVSELQGQMKFTQDGSMLACTRGIDLDIYTFDRCSGEFELFYTIDSVDSKGLYGCEWSPDGTKLYATSYPYQNRKELLYQYCLDCKVEISDTKDTIFQSYNNAFEFGQLQLASDNKIYMSSIHPYDTTFYNLYSTKLSVINEPNNLGSTCNFEALAIDLNNHIAWWGLPNMPNYNLGILAGSECDTTDVAINDIEKSNDEFTIYPNPATNQLFIKSNFPGNAIYEVSIYSLTGEEVLYFSEINPQQPIDISQLQSGLFSITFTDRNGDRYYQKFVSIKAGN